MDMDDREMITPVISSEDAETHAEDRGMAVPILLLIAAIVGYGFYYEFFGADDTPPVDDTRIEAPAVEKSDAAKHAFSVVELNGARDARTL